MYVYIYIHIHAYPYIHIYVHIFTYITYAIMKTIFFMIVYTYYILKEKIEIPHHAFQDFSISSVFSNLKQK